jgi:hypothetical protein
LATQARFDEKWASSVLPKLAEDEAACFTDEASMRRRIAEVSHCTLELHQVSILRSISSLRMGHALRKPNMHKGSESLHWVEISQKGHVAAP